MRINHRYDDSATEYVSTRLITAIDALYENSKYGEPRTIIFAEDDFVSLNPDHYNFKRNLLKEMLKLPSRRGMITAFLECCTYSKNFVVVDVMNLSAILDKFERYGGNSPDTITIHSEITGLNFNGTQYATFNLLTREFTFTKYVVTVEGSYNNRSGTGKLPVTDGYFII